MLSDKMEIRKDIREYEGLYQISNLGRIKSVNRKVGYFIKKEVKLTNENSIKCNYFNV